MPCWVAAWLTAWSRAQPLLRSWPQSPQHCWVASLLPSLLERCTAMLGMPMSQACFFWLPGFRGCCAVYPCCLELLVLLGCLTQTAARCLVHVALLCCLTQQHLQCLSVLAPGVLVMSCYLECCDNLKPPHFCRRRTQ